MTNYIVFIDSRGVITNNPDAFHRHENYVAEYVKRIQERSGEQTIFQILSGNGEHNISVSGSHNLKVYHVGSSFRISPRFLLRSFSILRETKGEIRGFICGDPWETFWTTYLLRFMLRIKAPIQVNIHADVFDPKWISQSFVNRIRRALLVIAIKNSSMIRAVSLNVQQEIHQKYPGCRVVLAPIPIMLPQISTRRENSVTAVQTIGWVGRIAEDRGIHYFIELLSRLNNKDPRFRVVIAGTGPLKHFAEQRLRTFLAEDRLIFLGQVNQSDLPKLYREMNVLVSCAKSESYGLSIREALMSGTPVWGIESIGVKRLQNEYGSNFVRLFDLKSSDEKLAKAFNDLSQIVVPSNVSVSILDNNQKHLNVLFDSWDKLVALGRSNGKTRNV
jgi:glycosyltransferase involved in cell wall biosynthesis